MVCGYTESKYTVEKSTTIVRKGHVCRLEHRRDPPNSEWLQQLEKLPAHLKANINYGPASHYLAMFRTAADDGPSLDVLLLYPFAEDGALPQVEADWARLTAEPDVALAELLWEERIAFHADGYRRDGSVVMY